MKIQSKLPDTLNKIIDKFLHKNNTVDKNVFMKIIEFVYKEGSIHGQNKYLKTNNNENE